MATWKFLIALVACALTITNVASQIPSPSGCSYPPCSTVPAGQIYYYPNWNDCDTYWTCQNQQARLSRCPAGEDFDLASYKCKPRRSYSGPVDFYVNPLFSCRVILYGMTASIHG